MHRETIRLGGRVKGDVGGRGDKSVKAGERYVGKRSGESGGRAEGVIENDR